MMTSLMELVHPKSVSCNVLLPVINLMDVMLINWSLYSWATIQRALGLGTFFSLRMRAQMVCSRNWNRRIFHLLWEKLETRISRILIRGLMDHLKPQKQSFAKQIWGQMIYMKHYPIQIWLWQLVLLWVIPILSLVLLSMRGNIVNQLLHSNKEQGLDMFCQNPQDQPLGQVWKLILVWSRKYVLHGHLLKDGGGTSYFPVIGPESQIKSCNKYLESILPSLFSVTTHFYVLPAEPLS